jgi:hypothetical protein
VPEHVPTDADDTGLRKIDQHMGGPGAIPSYVNDGAFPADHEIILPPLGVLDSIGAFGDHSLAYAERERIEPVRFVSVPFIADARSP